MVFAEASTTGRSIPSHLLVVRENSGDPWFGDVVARPPAGYLPRMGSDDTYPDKLRCRECGVATLHRVIHDEVVRLRDEVEEVGERHLLVVECRGCGEKAVATATYMRGDETPELTTFPEPRPAHRGRPEFDGSYDLPEDVEGVYSEVVTVYNTNSMRATGILLRTLVEVVCADLKCDRKKNLQGQIDQLVDKGLLSRAEADMLHLLRYLGNTTVHEGTEPDDDEVEMGLDIIEHLMETVYVVMPKGAEMHRAHERREKAKARAKARREAKQKS